MLDFESLFNDRSFRTAMIPIIIGIIVSLCFRLFWLTNVEKHEVGFIFNRMSGQVTQIDHTGWVLVTPVLNSVYTIEGRPQQVCINANQRVLNCKLVQFNPAGLTEFINLHGAASYTALKIADVLKVYAYEENPQPRSFLTLHGGTTGIGVTQ